jgi:plastocyanin
VAADTPTVEQTAPVPADIRRVTIRETDFALHPVRADGGHEGLVTIRILNRGKLPHALAVDGPNGTVEFDGKIDPGFSGTLEVDLDRAGTYRMYCPLDGHRAKGMEGTISVAGTQPARAAEPTTTTPTATTTTPTSTTRTTTQTQTQTTRTETKTVTTPAGSTGPSGY